MENNIEGFHSKEGEFFVCIENALSYRLKRSNNFSGFNRESYISEVEQDKKHATSVVSVLGKKEYE